MRPRLVTLALAAAALALFYALLFPKPIPFFTGLSRPLSTDAGDDGELALWRWLQAESIPVASLRYRYDQLERLAGAADRGNVLLSVMPHRLPARLEEWPALSAWVEHGNTLLLMAALEDTPRWTLGTESAFLGQLRRAAQMDFSVLSEPGAAGGDASARAAAAAAPLQSMFGQPDIDALPLGTHPLLQGVQRLHASSDLPASRWRAQPLGEALPLALAQRAEAGEPVLWLLRAGAGQVIVSSLATPLSNREIAQAQNAQLLANVIAWARSPQGRVIFDDAHQGLVDYYDAKAFFGDPRLHRTLAWLVLLWLVFVLGPLAPPLQPAAWTPVDESALIDASGRFYSAAVAPLEAARRLFENFFDALRARLGLSENGAPLWDWLDTQAAVSRAQRAQLQQLYARVCAGERVDLRRVQNLLSDIQGRLS